MITVSLTNHGAMALLAAGLERQLALLRAANAARDPAEQRRLRAEARALCYAAEAIDRAVYPPATQAARH